MLLNPLAEGLRYCGSCEEVLSNSQLPCRLCLKRLPVSWWLSYQSQVWQPHSMQIPGEINEEGRYLLLLS